MVEGQITTVVRRIGAGLTGALTGIGVGILIADGRWWPVAALIPLGAATALLVRSLALPVDRLRVAAVVAFAGSVHIAAAVLFNTVSLALGRGGFGPGDDIAYAYLSDNFVRYLRGEAVASGPETYWGGNEYLFGTWVYLESAIFWITGPEVLVPIFFNGAFAIAMSLLAYDIAGSLFRRTPALVSLVLTAFFPSIVLWSSLNLKDALALLLIALCLWSLVRFARGHRWSGLALAFAVLIPMQTLRPYLYFGLAIVIPLAVAVAPQIRLGARARWTAAAVLLSGAFLFVMKSGVTVSSQMLQGFEEQRLAAGLTARTRFVPAPPIIANEGDTFVVLTPPPTPTPTPTPEPTPEPTPPPVIAASPTATPAPTVRPSTPTPTPVPVAVGPVATPARTPNVVHVPPNAQIVVVTSSPTLAPSPAPVAVVVTPRPTRLVTPAPKVVFVRPGDIVVIGGPDTTPGPVVRPIPANAGMVQLRDREAQDGLALARTIEHLPRGLSYAFFAPFPWQIDRAVDIAVIPDMLLWYVVLGAAGRTLFTRRRDWQALFAVVAVPIGLLFMLSLVEGNVGSLYRHRSMAQAWVLLLASPTLAPVLSQTISRVTGPRPVPLASAYDAA